MTYLRPTVVPPGLQQLIPLAERWGIGDDFERSAAVRAASLDELRELREAVDAVEDDVLYGWLAGEESHNPSPSPEYLAFTNMTMALDEGRARLRRHE